MKQIYLILILLLSAYVPVAAQNKENKWLVGIGSHGPQMTIGDQSFWHEYFQVRDWNITPAAAHIKAYRYVTKGLSIGTNLSVGTASRRPGPESNRDFFLSWGLDVKYNFANGMLWRPTSWFDPYVVVGGGLSKWGDVRGSINAGAGVNIWIVKNFGLFIQASYNYLPHKKPGTVNADDRPSFMHHTFGIVARLGKGKDSDHDGVADVEDKCPYDPGSAENNGCPDTDGDKIIDKDDKCPTVAGLAAFGGCPDTDGDGIPDPQDKCPRAKGPASTQGCPDADGDGVADKEDKCPSEKGEANTAGCPDTDKDGVADVDDACPTVKGPMSLGGCPDSDGDGVLDKDDKCPNVYGMADNSGCPHMALDEVQKKALQQKLNFAAKNIYFETGLEKIKKESLDDLDNVVAIMKQYDFIKLSIEGHTDNAGREQDNVSLSNRRAGAVAAYLASKGVLPTRLTSVGYGPFRPVGSNDTPEGRKKNRRVEILIKD